MSFLALVAALLLEQWRPLADRGSLYSLFERYATFLERLLGGGESKQGMGILAWLVAVVPPLLGAWLVYALAQGAGSLFALSANVVILYLTMGFRQQGRYFAEIQLALKDNDIAKARDALSAWRRSDCGDLDREAVARLAIEEALIASHHHVFAVIFWFAFLPGPLGAILYRLAMFLSHRWGGAPDSETGHLRSFARSAFAALDWLPARLAAGTFAVVGDFEDAVYCWRAQAASWADYTQGVVLASGAGALGVKLGMPIRENGEVLERPELGLGDPVDEAHMETTVGLIWRALMVWLIVLLLVALVGAVT
jgi:adenosylcobinamide-phosphate synthase